jgi:hypothetical protein
MGSKKKLLSEPFELLIQQKYRHSSRCTAPRARTAPANKTTARYMWDLRDPSDFVPQELLNGTGNVY